VGLREEQVRIAAGLRGGLCAVVMLGLAGGWSPSFAGKLEDLLLENKQITRDQWVQLKAEEERRQAKQLEQLEGGVTVGDIPLKKRWYEKIGVRGYTQFRYNHTLDNELLRSPDDRSVGAHNEFFLRRARLIFSGQPHDRVFFYFQPDFANEISGVEQAGILRDLYTDLFLTQNKEWRIRAGLSKVPYGFENMQSSSMRLSLDRADALDHGVPGMRDLGLFLYYTPATVQERFKRLVDSGLKGSGNYGMLGVGVYNGQGLSVRDQNTNKHAVFHSMYPHEFPNGQILQVGMDAYTGRFNVTTQPVISTRPPIHPEPDRAGEPLATHPLLRNNGNYQDERVAWHIVLFPQPFGLQAEYTIGRGPELNVARSEVVTGNIRGGYVQLFYRYQCDSFCLSVLPYVRVQEYFGGIKSAPNAPHDSVRELELGLEYQFNKALEFTIAGTFTSRDSPDPTFQPAGCIHPRTVGIVHCHQTPYQRQAGNLLRFQLQWNY
jgi:hypothetical protein